MKCGELIEYLQRFAPEELVATVVVDIEQRLYYKIGACQLLDESPALLLEVSGSGPLDEIAEEDNE